MMINIRLSNITFDSLYTGGMSCAFPGFTSYFQCSLLETQSCIVRYT